MIAIYFILLCLHDSLGFAPIVLRSWRSSIIREFSTNSESQELDSPYSSASTMLKRSAMELIAAGDDLMDAATYLGEYGLLAYDPASLSSAGCAITNAGRDMLDSVQYIFDSNWEEASLCLSAAADNLDVASGADILEDISSSAKHLSAACSIQGCIVMACAAVPDLILCASALVESGKSMSMEGISMTEGGKVECMAGDKVVSCAQHLVVAGNRFEEFACLLDKGRTA